MASRSRRRHQHRRLVSVTAATAAMAALATASAPTQAATTIGQTGAPATCGSGFMEAQFLVASSPTYFVPSDGVITSWSAASNVAPQQAKLLVLERVTNGPPPAYRIVAKSDYGTYGSVGVSTFPTQIPVRMGQEIGIYGYVCAFISPGDVAAASGSAIPEPAIGQEQTLTSLGGDRRADVSANLEPDCDGDGNGDETQDASLIGGTCPRRTLSLDVNKHKVKKGKKVRLSGRVTPIGRQGAECLSSQPVELLKKKPSASDFRAFATVQSDAQGNFSLKKKVKKTTEFSARLQPTASCVAASSETETVKVKKKK
jgi:hypothetical protein